MYGSMRVLSNGKEVIWLWDYVNEKPRLETEMTKNEIAASEKAKWLSVKQAIHSTK
jgi:hypothetical protein